MVSSLQHDKSFVVDSTASSVFAIALYNRSLLITSSHDVIQKDIETGSLERKFIGHTGQIFSLMVINDSTMITSGWDDMIILWNLITGSIMKRIWLGTSKTFPNSIGLLSNNLLVCGKDGKVRIVNIISSKVAQTINVNGEANVIVVSGDYFYVGKGGMTSNLVKYSVSKRSLQLSYIGHQSTVLALFLKDDKLFSGSTDTSIICWNEYTSRLIRIYEGHIDSVRVVSIHDNYMYSSGQDVVILKWNIDSGDIEERFPVLHKSSVSSFAVEQGILYSGSLDTTVIKWDLNASSKLFAYSGRNKRLRSVVLWKNLVIASGDTATFKIHDKSQDLILPIEIMSGHLGDAGCLLVHGDILYSGSTDKTIRSLSLIDLTGLRVYYGHSNTVSALEFNEKFLYSGSFDSTVKRWNITSGSIDKEYIKHTDRVLTIQIGPTRLYSGSMDETLRVWDKETATMIDIIDYSSLVEKIYIFNDIIIVASFSLDAVSLSTGEVLARQEEPSTCLSIVVNMFRVYSGHENGLIRGRDPADLSILETFQGHQDFVMSLCLDDVGILFSTGFDGSVKKWNMASRKVSFSLEDINGSVTALSALNGALFIGTREGTINTFSIYTACIMKSSSLHQSAVTSLNHLDSTIYSSGMDGMIYRFNLTDPLSSTLFYDAESLSLNSMALNMLTLVVVRDETEIVIIPKLNVNGPVRSLQSTLPLVCIAADEDLIFAGSKAGSIVAWNATYLQTLYFLEEHTSQVNFLLVAESNLYSASSDKTILKWSLKQRVSIIIFQRLSATALGHLGTVNALALCRNALFSASSDLTTRRWNPQTGNHEDVYFGPTKSVTTVICHNGSVFAGSEDFSVLMYSPGLALTDEDKTSTKTSTNTRRGIRTVTSFTTERYDTAAVQNVVFIGGMIAIVVLVAVTMIAVFYRSSTKKKAVGELAQITQGMSDTTTDVETVINTVVGISKHAAYLIETSALATTKKIAAGGGGELYLATVMDPTLRNKIGQTVVQKTVFIKSEVSNEAFYQEVGIMIMLSSFPNFCRILCYTEKPCSIILEYYPEGSLNQWLKTKKLTRKIALKILMEISQGLNVMHSHYLAHCDLKPQNILVQVSNGIPTCFITDFGITQVLSDTIIAAKSFHVMNLRGLSVNYASPEAFKSFKTKNYSKINFKMFDVYSFGSVSYEVQTSKPPWL